MQRKILTVFIAATLIFALGLSTGSSSEKQSDPDTVNIMQKLEQILENQAQILKQFEQVMQELEIIKIRASR